MKLATLPLVVLLALVSWASGETTSGDWTYVIENGGATITASTAIGDVTIPSELGGYAVKKVGRYGSTVSGLNTSVFGDRNTSVTSVTIGNGVTSVGEYAFANCLGLTSVTMASSVTNIGKEAFYQCTGLTSLVIPDSVTRIGDSAFFGCTGLTSVSIPGSVTRIGDSAFELCTGLTSVDIPNSVTSIGGRAFDGWSGLTSVIIGNGVASIGESAFETHSRLASVIIPYYTVVGPLAFSESVTLIRDYTSLFGRDDFVASLVDKLANTLATNSTFITNLAEAIKSANGNYGIATQSGVSDTITTATSTLATKAEITTAINEGKASGIASVTASPNTWSLFTTSQIQNMAVGDLVLSREVDGGFVLNYDIEQSEDLVNWTPYQALSLPLTGLPTNKAFIRIRAKQ
jgi:hypothetical protein